MKVVEFHSVDGAKNLIPPGGVSIFQAKNQILIYAAARSVADKVAQVLNTSYTERNDGLFVFSLTVPGQTVRDVKLLLVPIR